MDNHSDRIKVYQNDSLQQLKDVDLKKNIAIAGLAAGMVGAFSKAAGLDIAPLMNNALSYGGIGVSAVFALGVECSFRNVQRNNKAIADIQNHLNSEKPKSPKL